MGDGGAEEGMPGSRHLLSLSLSSPFYCSLYCAWEAGGYVYLPAYHRAALVATGDYGL